MNDGQRAYDAVRKHLNGKNTHGNPVPEWDDAAADIRDTWEIMADIVQSPLRIEIDRILAALRDLHDEQNGPPLIRRETQWRSAMDTASAVLKEAKHD